MLYHAEFVAANQETYADNIAPGTDKQAHLEQLRVDMRRFKTEHGLDRARITPGVNDTADALFAAVNVLHLEVSPSMVFAVASILEPEPAVNGALQNTSVPGVIELAERHKAFIGGDNQSQARRSSSLYLDNNDGHNVSVELQFKSKEISKRSIIDDMVASHLLFKHPEPGAAKGTRWADHL
ncbi:uncharacterized protein B0H18DRAFT_1118147 [Fomitopsis serialis]|uniref:uncharacterized protein n=1 Tax=Fomitopsis serialis TaxID=139415 RepID=UPI00200848A6|nr:uncharacterized protein B0H18DRAFT_1118147 [Neoantrodia serialis]KAH9928128.1 hypothetical protein B0H18DRAFT_1118147 [Neoantrodia serialis]